MASRAFNFSFPALDTSKAWRSQKTSSDSDRARASLSPSILTSRWSRRDSLDSFLAVSLMVSVLCFSWSRRLFSWRIRLSRRTTSLLSRVAEARQTAFEYRTIARAGGDPLALKRRPDMPTFAEAVETVIGIHREGWKDAKTSERQWRASLRDYAMPRLGQKRVDQITTADVMAVLIPHWHTKRETMQRVRQRIGTVMKWAVAQGYRDDNPTGDVISAALPKNGGVRRHQRALPFGEVGAALHRVKRSGAFEPTVLAFEFLVLTACRSGEVRLATWDEVDLESATWTVPANRMKSKRDHRVPLSARAQGVLQEAQEFADSSGLVFPSPRGGAISANTISKLLRELDIDAVPHGFRSSFRDWAAECSDAPREVCELALAHVNSDRVEAAYRRTDLFEQRRVLMEQWSGFVG